MSSYRQRRGVDTSFGEKKDMSEMKAQWGMITAARVLDCMFPETSLGDGNSVEGTNINKNKEYTPESLAQRAKEYFENIYSICEQGTPIIPDIEDFCMFAGFSRTRFIQICDGHDLKMSCVGNNIRNCIASCKKQMAMNGEIPAVVFAIDFNNNHDYIQARNQLQVQTQLAVDAQESIDDIASRIPIESE